MKRVLLLVLTVFFFGQLFAGDLVRINVKNQKELQSCFNSNSLQVHYYTDDMVIATLSGETKIPFILLEKDVWAENSVYYIAWFHKGFQEHYLDRIPESAEILEQTSDFLIISSLVPFGPPDNGRIVKINQSEAKLPIKKFQYTKSTLMQDSLILVMMADTDSGTYVQNLQHLQDYGTRDAYSPEAVQAQNWIKTQFESYGYTNVELFDFSMPNGAASDNVIAKKIGTKYPDEFVVIGAHYDSYSFSGSAPGADDNGTGTCGVMEVARVMAQHDFDRSILFCTWSGEEYGLYGSEAYASWAAGQGMNILGYFNIDMCGYRHPGDQIHTDVIAPSSALPLVAFYTDICALYLPGFIVDQGALTGGDSDHTSFNNNGYMGIFPFEDSDHYSPYIHSPDDIIGLSVNSLEMAMTFTKAMVASVATMANWLAPPSNLVGIPGDEQIELSWDPLSGIDNYIIYKDMNPTPLATTTDPFYTDDDVDNFTTYTYYVTAIYTDTGDESDPSNMVTVTPMPAIAFPFIEDFENGDIYWNLEGSWGLTETSSHSSSHALTESPSGNYGDNLEISATMFGFDLTGATDASLSFWTKYNLEENYDYMYLEVSTDGITFNQIESYNGQQSSWTEESYSLNNYLDEPYVVIRFRFYSDTYVNEDGMYIDDLEINIEGGISSVKHPNTEPFDLAIFPNPVKSGAVVEFSLDEEDDIELTLFSATGSEMRSLLKEHMTSGKHTVKIPADSFENGVYFIRLKTGNYSVTKRLVVLK